MGSVEIRQHTDQNMMKPYVVKKAVEGDVIGFSEGDGNETGNPLCWLVSMQEQTEVVWIPKERWEELWNL